MIYKGQHVSTNEQGRRYYSDERQNLNNAVVTVQGQDVVHVKQDGKHYVVYTNCVRVSEKEN